MYRTTTPEGGGIDGWKNTKYKTLWNNLIILNKEVHALPVAEGLHCAIFLFPFFFDAILGISVESLLLESKNICSKKINISNE